MYKTEPKHIPPVFIAILLLLLVSVLISSCSPKIASVTTNTTVTKSITKTYRDSNIVIKADSGKAIIDIAKGLTEPQKKIIESINLPADTVKEGNIQIITSIVHGRIHTKVKTLEHKQLVKALNTDIKTDSTTKVMEVKVLEAKKPSFWVRLKDSVFYISIGLVIAIAGLLVWKFRKLFGF